METEKVIEVLEKTIGWNKDNPDGFSGTQKWIIEDTIAVVSNLLNAEVIVKLAGIEARIDELENMKQYIDDNELQTFNERIEVLGKELGKLLMPQMIRIYQKI